RRRQLKKRANKLEIAKMVTSLLKEKAQDPGGARSSPCPSDHSEASQPGPPPAVLHVTPPSARQHVALPPAPHTPQLRSRTPLASLPAATCGSALCAVSIYSSAYILLFLQQRRAPPQLCLNHRRLMCFHSAPHPTASFFESGKESDFALLRMALDNLLSSHLHLSEQYKYQVLLGHLKLPSALHLAKAYMHDPRPYTMAMQALQDKYGQPRQLVQGELGAILNAPALKFGDDARHLMRSPCPSKL
ncbi:hypothetical protein L3Q82_015384, partial [Scortum barcoo]